MVVEGEYGSVVRGTYIKFDKSLSGSSPQSTTERKESWKKHIVFDEELQS